MIFSPHLCTYDIRPTVGVELYELCVTKGRLWSVQATSTDKLFPAHEQQLKNVLLSFIPKQGV